MKPQQASQLAEHTDSSLRLEVQLHDVLMKPAPRPALPVPG